MQRTRTEDGSNSNPNFNALAYYGTVLDSQMPYEGDLWGALSDSPLAQQRCGGMPSGSLTGCLLGHYDPSYLNDDDATLQAADAGFWTVRNAARQFRTDQLAAQLNWQQQDYTVTTVSQVKQYLAQGVPLAMDISFYYGA